MQRRPGAGFATRLPAWHPTVPKWNRPRIHVGWECFSEPMFHSDIASLGITMERGYVPGVKVSEVEAGLAIHVP